MRPQQKHFSVNFAKSFRKLFWKTPPGDCFCKDLQHYYKENAPCFWEISKLYRRTSGRHFYANWTLINRFFYIQKSPLPKYCCFQMPQKVLIYILLFLLSWNNEIRNICHVSSLTNFENCYFVHGKCFVRMYNRSSWQRFCQRKCNYWPIVFRSTIDYIYCFQEIWRGIPSQRL